MSRKNPKLKRSNAESEYGKKEAQELIKCARNPIYFIENYVKIKHPLRGLINFELYGYQQDLIYSYEEHRYFIVLSARQTGKTETTCAYLLWFAIFNEYKSILVVSNKASNAKEIIGKIQHAYEELPNWLKPGIDDNSWNKHECKFDNKSRILAETTSAESGRGMSLSKLYGDEFAFVRHNIQEEFWDSIYPTLSCVRGDTRIITDRGMVNIEELCDNRAGQSYEPMSSRLSTMSTRGESSITHIKKTPPSEIIRLTTESGRVLETNKNHPIITMTDETYYPDMIKARSIKMNDYVRVDIDYDIFGNNELSDDLILSELWKSKNGLTRKLRTLNRECTKRMVDILVLNKAKIIQNHTIINGLSTETKKDLQLVLNNLGYISIIRPNSLIIQNKKYIPNIQLDIIRPIIEKIRSSNDIKFDIVRPNYNHQQIKRLLHLIDCGMIKLPRYDRNILADTLRGNIVWEKVKSVTVETEDVTYDLTVPNGGSFLQNGIMGSNTGGSCILSSTPNGDANLFAALWRKTELGNSEFKGTHIPWDAPPDRDEDFKEKKIQTLGINKWRQEYECKFLSAEGTLIDSLVLSNREKKIDGVKPAFVRDDLNYWLPIGKDKKYLISCDPASGSDGDNSVISVFEFPEMVQIAEFFSSKIASVGLYAKLKDIVNFVHDNGQEAFFTFERNAIGESLAALYETDMEPPRGVLVNDTKGNELGFYTSPASKGKYCIKMKEMLENGTIKINSLALLTELKSFTKVGNTFKALPGSTDDRVMALFLIVRMIEEIASYDGEAYDVMYGTNFGSDDDTDDDDYDDSDIYSIMVT